MDDLFTGRRKAGYHVARSGTHWCWCYSHCQMKPWIYLIYNRWFTGYIQILWQATCRFSSVRCEWAYRFNLGTLTASTCSIWLLLLLFISNWHSQLKKQFQVNIWTINSATNKITTDIKLCLSYSLCELKFSIKIKLKVLTALVQVTAPFHPMVSPKANKYWQIRSPLRTRNKRDIWRSQRVGVCQLFYFSPVWGTPLCVAVK